MSKPKITEIKTKLNSTVIPATQAYDNGDVGRKVEKILQNQGWPINSATSGADIEHFDLEIKTRKHGSDSRVTVGSMTVDKIANTDYQRSPIKRKLQTVRWIEYREDIFEDTSTSVVKEDLLLDLDDPEIQKELETQFNAYIDEISQNNELYKKNDTVGWWEKKSSNSWAFRVPYTNWKGYIQKSLVRKSFNEMFG